MANIDLKHVAKLSRLSLTEEELRYFEGQVARILEFVEALNRVNVDAVEPTSHPLSLSDVFREDVPQPGVSIETFLKHAPKARGRFFEVPKIIEDKS
jgi:aspartyl-tRNA(Asn)/glutamyl-tRNA(Gln) amidotransferase subunit C